MLAVELYFHLIYEKLEIALIFPEGFDGCDDACDVGDGFEYLSGLCFSDGFDAFELGFGWLLSVFMYHPQGLGEIGVLNLIGSLSLLSEIFLSA